MLRSKSVRSISPVPSRILDRNLTIYSAAAVAAGVGLMALAQPAEGKVIVTTKTIHLPLNHVVSLDLNHDGVTDFQFDLQYISMGCEPGGSLTVRNPTGNRLAGAGGNYGYASALKRGANIGPAQFSGVGTHAHVELSFVEYCSGSSRRSSRGNWSGNLLNRYLGVKFLINGATHFGWIRMSVDFTAPVNHPPTATITAYGYETVSNKPTKAGSAATAVVSANDRKVKTARSSLGVLALGADGLAIWRREETFSTI